MSTLAEGPEGRIDYANEVIVDLQSGAFENITRNAILSGGNLLAVESDAGAYEIIQFQAAEEIAVNRWQLTNLIRAQAGTDDAMRAGASAGANVVLINEATISLGLEQSEMGLELNWKISSSGKSTDHLSNFTFAGGARANTPLSPVHLRASRTNAGILISWTRRSRYNADSWLGIDVPLDEDVLAFQLEIFDGSDIVRTIDIDDVQYLYPSADEITDFGTEQSQITFQIRQLGGQIASGIARKAEIVL